MPGYREEPGVDPLLADRDVRGAAAGRRQLALGRRAVLRAHRQAAAEARSPRWCCSSSARRTCRSAPAQIRGLEPDALILRIQPDEGITLRFGAKVPGHHFRVRSASMEFSYEATFREESPEAYERLCSTR